MNPEKILMIRLFLRKTSNCLIAIIFLYIGLLMKREENGMLYLIFLTIGGGLAFWHIFRISSTITMGQLIERTTKEIQFMERVNHQQLVSGEQDAESMLGKEINENYFSFENIFTLEAGRRRLMWTLLWMAGISIAYNGLFHSLLTSLNETTQIIYMMVIVAVTFLLNSVRVYYKRIIANSTQLVKFI